MLRRIFLAFPVLPVLLAACVYAERAKPSANSPNETQEKDAAPEKVFAGAARKVVFVLTRKSGELLAGASGIILTADGYIATNCHALQGADSVEIRYFRDPQDSQTYQSFNRARLLYANPDYDIAVLKVNRKSKRLCARMRHRKKMSSARGAREPSIPGGRELRRGL